MFDKERNGYIERIDLDYMGSIGFQLDSFKIDEILAQIRQSRHEQTDDNNDVYSNMVSFGEFVAIMWEIEN